VCSDLFTSIKKTGYDFIVSNPPYVSEDEMKELDPSVSRYEPHKALWGGKDGMDFYRYLSAEGKKVLKPGGRIYCEIGYSQGEKSGIIFSEASWSNIKILNDLTSRPRVVMATCDNF
jgi:release factor glutamine methyltransferase